MEQVELETFRDLLNSGKLKKRTLKEFMNYWMNEVGLPEDWTAVAMAAPQYQQVEGCVTIGNGWFWWGGDWYREEPDDGQGSGEER